MARNEMAPAITAGMRKLRAAVLLFPFLCCFSSYWSKMHRLKKKKMQRLEALRALTKARLYASLIMNSGDIRKLT